MGKQRDLDRGDVLPASWTDSIQEFVGTLSSNLRLTMPQANVVQVVAEPGVGQAAVGIGGLWRYRSSAVSVTVSGATGQRDLLVTAQPNDFRSTPQPDTDATTYSFGLESVASGGSPVGIGVVAWRKIAEIDWDSATSSIVGLRQIVGSDSARDPVTPTAPAAGVAPVRAIGVTGQTTLLSAQIGTSTPVFVVGGSGDIKGRDLAGRSATLTGSLNAASISTSGNLHAQTIDTPVIDADTVLADAVGVTGTVSAQTFTATTLSLSGSLSAASAVVAGNISGASLGTSGNVTAANGQFTDRVSARRVRVLESATPPASPLAGDIWYYRNGGHAWYFVYDNAGDSTYPWCFIGGSSNALYFHANFNIGIGGPGLQGTYVNNFGLTVPMTGLWDVTGAARVTTSPNCDLVVALYPANNPNVDYRICRAANGDTDSGMQLARLLIGAGNQAILGTYTVSAGGGGGIDAGHTTLAAQPYRVTGS